MNNHRKKQIITRFAPILGASGIPHLVKPFFGGEGHILTFHRVIPDGDSPRIHNHESLEVSPEHLEAVIQFFAASNYQFYSLDQVADCLEKGTFPDKFVCFTFDDGYQDVYQYAYPIFKQYEVPFAIYISTNFPDQTAILWWYMLEDFLISSTEAKFQWQGQDYAFSLASRSEKEAAFARLRTLILQEKTQESQLSLLHCLFEERYPQLLENANSMAMSWDEIVEMSQDPLVTIGAHTQNHLPLSQISELMLEQEVAGSKAQIESYIQKRVDHFAYPFGKRTEASFREFQSVKSAGFRTATTTRIGNIFPGHKAYLEALPRISINRATNNKVLALQTTGLIPMVVNKGKQLVTD
ncbi:MAG: polysaccharide deacetylase family protein [Bacteroidota bacterium]